MAAPASAPIGVDYTFYDTNGNNQNLDTTFDSASSVSSGNDVNLALYANQPSQVSLLGLSGNANHTTTATGSVYAVFFCPDATICENVLPQLIYSALPSEPWSLSVPISWDTSVWTQWSAVGVNNGSSQFVSLVIYNEDTTATSFTIRVYDSNGNQVATGTTPTIAPLPSDSSGNITGEGGTYGILLSDVIKSGLPSGVFKILVDGGTYNSAVEVLQFNGPSATSLQVAYDSAPGDSTSVAFRKARRRSGRVATAARHVFSPLPR